MLWAALQQLFAYGWRRHGTCLGADAFQRSGTQSSTDLCSLETQSPVGLCIALHWPSCTAHAAHGMFMYYDASYYPSPWVQSSGPRSRISVPREPRSEKYRLPLCTLNTVTNTQCRELQGTHARRTKKTGARARHKGGTPDCSRPSHLRKWNTNTHARDNTGRNTRRAETGPRAPPPPRAPGCRNTNATNNAAGILC
jgi:hypothetical protein